MTEQPIDPLPEDYPVLSPKIAVADASAALAFYTEVFGAKLLFELRDKRQRVVHAELGIGRSRLMLGDQIPEYDNYAPAHFGGSAVHLHLYVKDADATMRTAQTAGAKVLIPVEEQFYGERSGRFVDPFGHVWILATRVEDVSAAEIARRWNEIDG